ncbi:hypothetical protein HAX54_015732 [Datura stramonium]|uniref:FAM50A/XAP5 C-terminal domain-containing protein n=1 Tax=Datura stramonium TaxID=4076 RepID=A0ABS8UJX4_DATST|nr:hypothetical protein [Datura stramonium]
MGFWWILLVVRWYTACDISFRNSDMHTMSLYRLLTAIGGGAGHEAGDQVRKGDSIGDLRAVQQLAPEFREVRTTSVENLLYVKEDLIIPHQHSFYELIINKARERVDPLFHFDVHEDVRTIADATIEKDESHAGKVVERHWYEKNKHIFPASRWEIYDPTKKWERYTIHGLSFHVMTWKRTDGACIALPDRIVSLFDIARSVLLNFARVDPILQQKVVEGTEEGGDLRLLVSVNDLPFLNACFRFYAVVAAGEESELLVGMKNDVLPAEESILAPIPLLAVVTRTPNLLMGRGARLEQPHLSEQHYIVKLSSTSLAFLSSPTKAFNNATVPPSAQATFPYIFAVSKFMQPGSFDLVGTIIYEIDQNAYQNVFYNGTIEVTEPGGLLSVEVCFSCFVLVSLSLAFLGSGYVVRYKIYQRAPKAKVEVGTATTDASTDEWLQGTAYTQSQANKLKKKK